MLLYPPSLLRLRQAYVGGPIGDKDLELRLEASETFKYVETKDDAWESTSEGCGFRFNYNTESGVSGNIISLDNARLCIQQKSLDLYAVQGVEISTPYEDPTEANDTDHWVDDYWYWYRFTYYDLLRHKIFLGTVYPETLGISGYNLTTWQVEDLLDVVDIRGPHALANMYKVCTGSSSGGFECSVSFDFWGKTEIVELSDQSDGKRLAAEELDSLVQNGDVLEGESESAAKEVCDSFDGEVTECDIECDIHYPYSSSLCTGSVEIREIGGLPFSTSIAALSLVLLLATLVVAFTTRYFAGGGWRSGRPHAQENPINSTPPLIMSTSNDPSEGGVAYAVGHDGSTRQRAVVESVDQGRVIPLGSWPGCVALLSRGGVGSCFRVSGDSVVLACCILEHGMIRNATVTEVGAKLEPAQAKEFMAASRNTNTLEWASAFSVYHCISCVWIYGVLTHVAVSSGWGAFYWLLALFTYGFFSEETCLGTVGRACRFRGRVLPYSTRSEGILLPSLLGAAQLWYELGLPNGWILSWGIFMFVTVIVTANVILVCIVYRKLPTADRAHSVTRTSWSVEDAMELCRASGSPFGMAGDWIERSRCGDIAGRTASMTSLGRVEPNRGSRLGHVYKRSQTSWAAQERGGQPIEAYGGMPGVNEGLCLEEEQMMSYSGELVMVCAERSSEPKESRH